MQISEILHTVESSIRSPDEHTYFLIHEARYKRILEEIGKISIKGVNVSKVSNDKTLDTSDTLDTVDTSLPHLRILDVGCFPYHLGAALELMGPPRLAASRREAGYEVWGIASAHEPIKNKNVAILNIETDRFPYKNNFFDLVLCSEVVEHLPQSPVPALKEMYRVTKPGGRVLITTPNITRSINQGKMLLGRAPMYAISAFLENQGRGSNLYHRHNREFTLGELTRLTGHAGWQIDTAKHFVSYTPFRRRNKTDHPLLWTGKLANFLLMRAIPRLADTLLVIGEK